MAILRITSGSAEKFKKNQKIQILKKFVKKSHQSVYWSLRGFGRPYLAANNKWVTYFKILRKVKKTCFYDFLDRNPKAISWLKTKMRA